MDILIPPWPVRGPDWLEPKSFQEIPLSTVQSSVWTGTLQSHTVHVPEKSKKILNSK